MIWSALPFRLTDLLSGSGPEKPEISEMVVVMQIAPAILKVDVYVFRQPQGYFVLRESHSFVVDSEMLAFELNLRNRLHQVGFHTHDLTTIFRNPGSSLQRERMCARGGLELQELVGTVGPLLSVIACSSACRPRTK